MRWILTCLVCAFVFTTAANAQLQCGPRKFITDQLKKKFHESSGGLGLSNGILFEIWASPDTGTFIEPFTPFVRPKTDAIVRGLTSVVARLC